MNSMLFCAGIITTCSTNREPFSVLLFLRGRFFFFSERCTTFQVYPGGPTLLLQIKPG